MQLKVLLRTTLAILLQAITMNVFSQVIYVNRNATGANDGTSWVNAFTDLSAALAAATDDVMIWVAGGTYHPGGSAPDTSSVFAVRNKLSMLGGFNGNESSVDERNPVANATILSGDINDDDITGDFVNNRSDNTRHVMYIEGNLDLVIIDGFTIKGGHTRDNQAAPLYDRAGGGIYAISPVNIHQCIITGNFGRAGGGILLTQGASNSSITQCTFSHNKTSNQGAGLHALVISNLLVEQCTFNENQTVRGALYPATCNNVLVNDCLFQDNHNTTFNGGAMFSFQNIDLVVRNCDFIRNSALVGGGIVVNGGQLPFDTITNIRIEQCYFEENTARDIGASIYYLSNPDITIKDCEFVENSAMDGGAVFIEQPVGYVSDTSNIRIDNCEFTNNNTESKGGGLFLKFTSAKIEHTIFKLNSTNGLEGVQNIGGGAHVFQNCPGQNIIFRDVTFEDGISYGFAGAATAYGAGAQYLFDHCVFSRNQASRLGGAVHHQTAAVATYRNCLFEENKSIERSGGALSTEDDSTTVIIKGSTFNHNNALLNGGAIYSGFGSGSVIIDKCEFLENSVTAGFGGAIYMTEQGNDNISSLTISNTKFGFNRSNFSGGAIYTEDAELTITSSLFYENMCNEKGHGGTMLMVASDMDTVDAMIINTTLAYNHGGYSDGIAQSTGSTESILTTTLINNIFRNAGESNYAVVEGAPIILSRGGNMSDDNSMNTLLTNAKDLNQTAPEFNDPFYFDYSLKSDSPGVDAGVSDGSPEFDIIGNPRVNEPDMGAYENQFPVSTKETESPDSDNLKISPNPVGGEIASLTLTNAWRGDLNVNLIDCNGRNISSAKIFKTSDTVSFNIPVINLSPGMYQVQVSDGKIAVMKSMIRM